MNVGDFCPFAQALAVIEKIMDEVRVKRPLGRPNGLII